jgi:uncharacterized protein (DUF111 family)
LVAARAAAKEFRTSSVSAGREIDSPTVTLLIETNIDDMTPEMLGYLQEQVSPPAPPTHGSLPFR